LHAKHNLHERLLVHPKMTPKFLRGICYIVCKIIRVKQKSTYKSLLILVLRLPNPRTTPTRDDKELLSAAEQSGQNHHSLFMIGGSSALSCINNSIIISSFLSIATGFTNHQTLCGCGRHRWRRWLLVGRWSSEKQGQDGWHLLSGATHFLVVGIGKKRDGN
jgi:hypothetical protein